MGKMRKMRRNSLSLFLTITLLLSCCSSVVWASSEEAVETQQEPVTLKFYCYASEQADQQRVFDELNKYFQEKYNTTVDFQFVMGSFADKMNVVINSGEEYDACFTSNWINNYVVNVSKEAFVDISGMLDDYPALYNAVPEYYWKAATVNGSIYAVPNIQIAARQPAWYIFSDEMEQIGVTAEDVATWTSLSDAKDYVEKAYELNGSKIGGVTLDDLTAYCGYEQLNDVYTGAVVKFDDPTCTVVNFFETDEFKALCNEMVEYQNLGLADGQAAIDGDYCMSQRSAKRICAQIAGTVKPGGDVEESNRYGVPLTLVGTGPSIVTTSGITATMWGISSTSKHPDRVMQILELFLTDPYVMNLVTYGIEGVHYEVVDGHAQPITDAGYAPGVSWAFGNVFLTLPQVGQPADVWEQTKKINEEADVSNLIGFNYSNANVQSEITNVNSVAQEYMGIVTGQMPVEETLNAFLNKLDTAGIDVIIADAQAQVDAFFGK